MVFFRWVLLLSCSLFLNHTLAQKPISLSTAFQQKLEQSGLFFLEPLDGGYKEMSIESRPYQTYDFAIHSRKEKMEIRYLLDPYQENNPLSGIPQVRAAQLITHLTTNEGEAMVIGQTIGQDELLEEFNADWGKVFFFEPKDAFSLSKECKLLVLHKAGAGTAYIFFLYDKISVHLDRRFLALQFK